MNMTVKDLSFSYPHRQILKGLSFSVEAGELIAVLGPNGTGKSTLFRCMLGSLADYQGTITVDGVDIRTLSQRKMAQKIAYIPQAHRPTFGYSVLDTVLMGTARQVHAFSTPKEQQIALARQAMERIGVEHLAERDFNQLSGGEQQLVLVARAIAQQSDILVMDEPTSALDYGNQLRVLQQVRKLAEEGYSVLLSTHDPQQALRFADRVLAISGGTIAAMGPAGAVMTPDLIHQLYGVTARFVETPHGRLIVPEIGG